MGRARWASRTHVGCVRAGNEDSFLVDEDLGFAVVCDGIGGEEGGEIASRIGCDALAEELRAQLADDVPADVALDRAVVGADLKIRNAADEDPALLGMGATVVAMLLVRRQAHVAYIGDSRAYLLRRDTRAPAPGPASPLWAPNVLLPSGAILVCLTRDHSTIDDLVELGRLSRAEGRCHPMRGQLLRALGRGDGDQPDLAIVDLEPGDRLLLCSDGLWEMIDDDRVAELLEAGSVDEAVATLLEAALAAGGDDNTTLVVVDP